MTIFAIIKQPGDNSERLGAEIARVYPLHHYDLGSGNWLVAGRGAAKDIADRLGITDGANGSAIIVEASSYYGRANPAIWTWISANWGAGSG